MKQGSGYKEYLRESEPDKAHKGYAWHPLQTYGALSKRLQRSFSKSLQVWLQVGQEVHLMPQRRIFSQALVFLQW